MTARIPPDEDKRYFYDGAAYAMDYAPRSTEWRELKNEARRKRRAKRRARVLRSQEAPEKWAVLAPIPPGSAPPPQEVLMTNEHDDFDLRRYAERKRAESGIQVIATITITETYTVGLDGEDYIAITATEAPGADRRASVQAYVENLHKWGAPGERSRQVSIAMKPA